MIDLPIFIITLVFAAIGGLVQMQLKSRFRKYSMTPTYSGLSGREIAEKMLADHGIRDVTVNSVRGQLTDHYNPTNKTVNLSEGVYSQRNVAAAAVAAHEVGHAVQHATSYSWLNFRSKMVPALSAVSPMLNIVLIVGLIMAFNGSPLVLGIGIALFALTTIFSLVTLPVEFDASNRALVWMTSAGITRPQEQDQAKDALKWAAMTYVVAALASITQLAYYIMVFMGSRDD